MNVWEFERDDDLGAVARHAMDGTAPADFTANLVASTGDTITLRVVSGTPSRNPGMTVYVEGRGAYEVLRREDWPPRQDDVHHRVQLMLRAWPSRE
jgi:hypothetical protein